MEVQKYLFGIKGLNELFYYHLSEWEGRTCLQQSALIQSESGGELARKC